MALVILVLVFAASCHVLSYLAHVRGFRRDAARSHVCLCVLLDFTLYLSIQADEAVKNTIY